MALWDRLPPATEGGAEPTGLGYRSCSLSSPGGERWVAFGGRVRRESREGIEVRRDAGREFERVLLASAPEGLLP